MDNFVTVSQLNKYLKDTLDNDINLKNIVLKGEVSNFTNHIKSGHFYFTLKDENASIRAIMFKTNAQKVKFEIKNGMNVFVVGTVKVFERDGLCQLYCVQVQPEGIGDLHLAFEQLKEKLSAQGLFSPLHKKAIPSLPKKIGVITSKTGAALQDILNILQRRYPIGSVLLIPALVQGDDAPKSLCDAIALAQKTDIDVLIITRGGGSAEDLWAFNDENVAYAVYNCNIPVISAVGHEVDFCICDFVSDLRAPTPSAAAELVAKDISQISDFIDHSQIVLNNFIISKINVDFEALKNQFVQLKSVSPIYKIQNSENILNNLVLALNNFMENKLNETSSNFKKNVSMLDALSPLKVLGRGYSITYKDDVIVRKANELSNGDTIKNVFSDSEIYSKVIK